MKELLVPADNERYRKLYESTGRGVCGPAVMAVLLRKNIVSILAKLPDYKGYMPLRELQKHLLSVYGIKTKWKNNHKKKSFPSLEKRAIARVQWVGKEGKYHGYKYFTEASRHTHFILIDHDRYFCNNGEWSEMRWLPEYLEAGYITSYLEIIK